MDVGEPFDRRLSRADMLRLAAIAAGAGVVAGPAAAADAAVARLTQESGRLQVLDWAGYGNDGGQAMFKAYVHKYPHNKPQFTYMTNESDALAKIQAGAHPDLFRPYVGWVKYFATERARPALGPEADPELQAPQPVHGQGGAVPGASSTGSRTTGASTRSSTARTRCTRRRARGGSCSTSGTRARSRGSTTSR